MSMSARGLLRPASVALVLAVVAPLLAGCSSPAEKKRGAMNGALKDFRGNLVTFDGRIEASLRAIDRLQSPSTFDVPSAYMQFLSELFNVSADAREVNQSAETMRATGADYYLEARKEAETKKDVNATEELQRRQSATRAEYDVLQSRLGELQEAYRIYLIELQGIRHSVERDQTRDGVALVGTELVEARGQVGKVRTAIAAAIDQTDKLSDAAAAPKK